MMEGDTRRAAKAAPLEQRASSSHLRIRTAVAARTEILDAVSRTAPTNKRRVAKLAATLLLLALLAVSVAKRSGRSRSATPAKEVGFAAEQSRDEPLGRQNSATAMHVATRYAPWVTLAAAQKVGNMEKELPTRGTLFQRRHDLAAATAAGLQGRLRGSGERVEALRIQQRGRKAEQKDTELPPQLPDARESEKVRTLAAAAHHEDSVPHSRSSGRQARPSGAALNALHSMLDKASTHLRQLADADLVAGEPNTERTAPGRAAASSTHVSEEAAKRGLQLTTEEWRRKYLSRVKEVKPTPVSHVSDEEAYGHGISAVFELPSNEVDSVSFDDDEDNSYGVSDPPVEPHISREDIRAALTDLYKMDVMQVISDKHYRPMSRESGGASVGQNAGNTDLVARKEDIVPLDSSLFALLDRPHSSGNVKPMQITKRRNAVTGAGTRRDAETIEASAGQSVPEDVTDTPTERATDSGTAGAETAADEAAVTPGAATPASLPQNGHYTGTQTSDLTRRYETIAPWAPQEALQYFNRKPTSSRPPAEFSLPAIPEVPEDSPSYFERYPPPSPDHDTRTTAGSRPQWEDEQLQYLLDIQSTSVFQGGQAMDIEHAEHRKPPAHTGGQQATIEDVIQADVAQKLYHASDSGASTHQHSGSNSAEGRGEKSSTTEASEKERGGDIRKNKVNVTGSSTTNGGSLNKSSKTTWENSKNNSVIDSGRGGNNEDEKSTGASRPGASSGPAWRRPPLISTMGTPFMTRPYPSWFPYLPNSSNEKTDKPIVVSPGVHRPGTPYPFRPNSRDDYFQYPQILCQLTLNGQGCVPPPPNEKHSRAVIRDFNTNADDVEHSTAGETTGGSGALEDVNSFSEEKPGTPTPGTPVGLAPSSPDIVKPSMAVDAFSPENDDEASVPPRTPLADGPPPTTAFFTSPTPTTPLEADVQGLPLSPGVSVDANISNSSNSPLGPIDPPSPLVSTQDHPKPPSTTLPEEDILPSQPRIAVPSPETPTGETDSSAAVSAPITTGSNATVVSPRPSTSATGNPTLNSGTSTKTNPFPAPFFPVVPSLSRLPPFMPLPFIVPSPAVPGRPLLPPFPVSQLPDPLATVVGTLVAH